MNKPLLLGKCKITFNHEYKAGHKLCTEKDPVTKERSKVTKVVSSPMATRVLVETDNGEKLTGRVVCSPRDMFTFEEGRKYALRRAFSKPSSLTKEDRRRVWDEYNKLKPGGRW